MAGFNTLVYFSVKFDIPYQKVIVYVYHFSLYEKTVYLQIIEVPKVLALKTIQYQNLQNCPSFHNHICMNVFEVC